MTNNIKKLRKARNLTLKELGALVGCTDSTVSKYELGRRGLDYELLQKFADALDCEVTELTNPNLDSNRIKMTLDPKYVELVYAYQKASDDEQRLVRLVLRDYWGK